MTAHTRCAWKLYMDKDGWSWMKGSEVLCAACSTDTHALPITENEARALADAEAVYCERCDALIFPQARQCRSCREWIEDPRDWSIDYCRKCAESAESVHRSDMQQAARFGTAGGHP